MATWPPEALRGKRGWIISDGKAGNDVQAMGVFDALGLVSEMKPIRPKGLHKILSPWIGVARYERFGKADSIFAPPFPDFAIAVGRLTTPYIRALKRLAGDTTFGIILLDPKVSLKTVDLFWVPQHDKLRGPNVITTLTSPHSFSKRRLEGLRAQSPADIAALPTPRVAVMLGGSNGDYTYTPEALDRLALTLRSLGKSGAGLMITPSRRTDPEIVMRARAATEGARRIFWDMTGDNPYPQFLAHADAFVVSADSVNMTGEACATGKPVYVFYPHGGSSKFNRFHEALQRYGATRPLPPDLAQIETWSYVPLNSAESIAREIFERWRQKSRP
jgi:mitochondrial fission protein ELM1